MSDTILPEPFRIRLLARHGSTIIYHGRLRVSGREIVLKIWLTPFMTPLQLQQVYMLLRQEVSRLQRLKHPHILTPLVVRKIWQGFVFVSNYAPAGSLQQILLRPLPQARALNIVRQVGEALQTAHQQGIVHGNLMPNNILFLQRETEIEAEDSALVDEQPAVPSQVDQVVLTDFYYSSLAAIQTFNTGNEHPQLRLYMAPEQFQGVRNALADQYALAAIAYELFTGSAPFAGSARTTLQKKHGDMLPSSPDKLNPSLSPAIAHAITKALAKNPAERFPSVQDFLSALEITQSAAILSVADTSVVTTKKMKVAPLTLSSVDMNQPEKVAGRPVRRKFLLPTLLLVVLLLVVSVFSVSGLYVPIMSGIMGKNSPTSTTTSRPTDVAQQVQIGNTAQDDTTNLTPTMEGTPGITATPGLMPTTTSKANPQVQATPTGGPQVNVTPTSAVGNNPTPTPPGRGTVQPIFECVQLQGSSKYLARFGYLNTSSSNVTIPVGANNMIMPGQYSSSLPTTFLPGRQYSVMQIRASDTDLLVWTLDGLTATASSLSHQC